MAEIRIKRVYEAPATDDGFRVLVDRLWPRGISKEHAALGAWWKDIAPSPELRTRIEEIAAHLAAGENVTLLYGAKDPELNQARVLCDFLHSLPHTKNK